MNRRRFFGLMAAAPVAAMGGPALASGDLHGAVISPGKIRLAGATSLSAWVVAPSVTVSDLESITANLGNVTTASAT